MNWHPLRFDPIYKERVWGGRRLAEVYGRQLPASGPIGESWEISDRAEGRTLVASGALAGRSLGELLALDTAGLMGDAPTRDGRFPLLVKILDAADVLSLQVHPPADRAASLGGEPKTEMWYFTATEPGAEILVGLRHGTTRREFETRLADGTVAACVHRVPVVPGDAMFLPSGRVHALGAGLLLFEVQESSDTTFRVFDWNRSGLDGNPRPLHIQESLASIDFGDFEPLPVGGPWHPEGGTEVRDLVGDTLFRVEARRARKGAAWSRPLRRCVILGVARGAVTVVGPGGGTRLGPGDFCLVPAALASMELHVEVDAEWLLAEPGAKESDAR